MNNFGYYNNLPEADLRLLVFLQEAQTSVYQALAMGEAWEQTGQRFCDSFKQNEMGEAFMAYPVFKPTDKQTFRILNPPTKKDAQETDAVFQKLFKRLCSTYKIPVFLKNETMPPLFQERHFAAALYIPVWDRDVLLFFLLWYIAPEYFVKDVHIETLQTFLNALAEIVKRRTKQFKQTISQTNPSFAAHYPSGKENRLETGNYSFAQNQYETPNVEEQIYLQYQTLKTLFDHSPYLYFVLLDDDFSLCVINQTGLDFWENEFGVAIETGTSFERYLRYLEPHIREAFLNGFEECVSSEAPIVFMVDFHSRRTGLRMFECRYTPLLLNESFSGVSLRIEDATDRKIAERQLAQKGAQLDVIINTAIDGVISSNEQNHIIVYNKAAERILGYAPGSPLYKYNRAFEDYILELTRDSTDTSSKRPPGEINRIKALRADGVQFAAEISRTVSHLETQTLYTIVFRDISEHLATQDDLKQSKEALKMALWAGGVWLWEINLKTKTCIFACENDVRNAYNFTDVVIQIEEWLEHIHHDDLVHFNRLFFENNENEIFQFEFRMKKADDKYVWFLNSGIVAEHTDKGTPLRITGALIDISKHKELEDINIEKERAIINALLKGQELERKRFAEELHDGLIQQLLGAHLILKVLLEQIDSDKNLTLYKNINTVSNVIELSLNETRSISHNLLPPEISKNGLKNAISRIISRLIQANGIKVTLDFNDEGIPLPPEVSACVYRLIQEATTNAVKHGKASEINIYIILEDDALLVSVEDDGLGFDPETIQHKNGIGLTNMQARVQAFGGRLQIDSAPEMGANFTFEIPLKNKQI